MTSLIQLANGGTIVVIGVVLFLIIKATERTGYVNSIFFGH
ncbi:hypothetical protein Nizo2535_0415 [Lactiplantibacillus plantarum]|nr:hypothetical protein FBR6_1919 [Lactiplantibacillus plantarum]KZU17598.1 hypothetical protein Nizo2484_3009 [Lactiplantibacillus plantarum]KZU29356.1 hypothetical protein Nizo2485_0693 [Lactiplantibacillus plantarum]KZU35588.1 hypothetical protein Nizo2535_0415 [Lactiplantibacillus plantarum]KZU79717.1 hypothetical protein Nizo2891_1468 [Lactiplantibacillus plantarum]